MQKYDFLINYKGFIDLILKKLSISLNYFDLIKILTKKIAFTCLNICNL